MVFSTGKLALFVLVARPLPFEVFAFLSGIRQSRFGVVAVSIGNSYFWGGHWISRNVKALQVF